MESQLYKRTDSSCIGKFARNTQNQPEKMQSLFSQVRQRFEGIVLSDVKKFLVQSPTYINCTNQKKLKLSQLPEQEEKSFELWKEVI